ncbi:dTMP kinase [Paludibacterium purpuratum]|uniref:Thymidylate kinase n=1 Tax=Paludibacterium purpuratum TaxID=1144873 RepID=A0A4R7BCG1_9NEIS|nr:dTMP kinase [Paludibacterium purpuratum]TDR81416.1 thymidylate kinase [Paludibacterium purpuratum]
MPPRFITLEGIDGAGKSSHLAFIREWLGEHGIDAVFTREPGGTDLAEKLRALLLAPETDVSLETETLLLFAARQDHIQRVIAPALEAGRWVVSDRFTDASFAYQGGGRGLANERLAVLEDWVQQGLQPDLTLLFDVSIDVAQSRMAATRSLDRFEREASDFHQRVRQAYLARAARYPRFCVLDSSRRLDEIRADIADRLGALVEHD